MRSRRRPTYRESDVTLDLLRHYRGFAADLVLMLGEEFAPIFSMIDAEIAAREAKNSSLDRIRQFAQRAA